MSEWRWIDRREREPKDHELVVVLYEDGSHGFTEWDTFLWALESATHWMPIPPPPPRTVTIDISEDDAREWARYPSDNMNLHEPSKRLYAACRAALAKMEGN